MGLKSHAQAEGFSAELNAYLKYIVNGNGREDLSGRWLTEITGSARARDYWSKFIKNERAMTTNDIDVLASAFGMSAFEFVRHARSLSEGETPEIPIVGGLTEDDYEQQPTSEQRAPERKAAKRGRLKGDQAFGESNEGTTGDGGESGA